ncbi:hypothetical protein FQN54_003082 [Arachnomyces sp. PD_36]|nr:hypothetical protein FQN54_003082 [Arachnomyces sp. PD_36]
MGGEDIQPSSAEHMCVLVHGLWGHPGHLAYLSQALREKHNEESLYILAAKSNTNNYTYDGIEVGGERVAREIEDTLESLAAKGQNIKKLSLVGYSLGGLVGRYAIGLLDSRGWFDKIEPVNFTAIASPFLGVRTPVKSVHLWNVLGSRVLSMSGRQLFMIDTFRDTGKPLLSVLATPGSIFMHALAKFKHRSLYANIVNDRTAVYYTTGVSRIDPFVDTDKIRINYVKGYEPNVLDLDFPLLPPEETEPLNFQQRVSLRAKRLLSKLPLYTLVATLLPLAATIFLINSGIQSVRSQQRRNLHEKGPSAKYRVPLLVQSIQHTVEDALESAQGTQEPEYLSNDKKEAAGQTDPESLQLKQTRSKRQRLIDTEQGSPRQPDSEYEDSSSTSFLPKEGKLPEFPTLALTQAQFDMIDALDAVGFRKYGAHIHKDMHSHAAIVVRIQRQRFDEGKVVIKHWLENEFEI